MTRSASQRRATQNHRRRAAARGLVRVEVPAAKADATLIRAVADMLLHGEPSRAESLRDVLRPLIGSQVRTAFDIFGSDLPDEAFGGVFDQPRGKAEDAWRPAEL